ncbi:MAG TPA: MFS transporter [Chthonomonadales bacterium]|nr:MFS transporter [Chthonomonadales bacterium]
MAPAEPDPRRDRKVAGSVVLGWMFLSGAALSGLVGPNRSAVEAELGIGHGAFGLGLAAIQVGCGLAGLALAPLLRLVPPARQMLAGMALVTAGLFTVCFTQGDAWLAVGWSIFTFGSILAFVANTLGGGIWSADPRRGVMLLHAVNGAGKAAGPMVAAVALAWNWRWSIVAVAAMAAVTSALVAIHQGALARVAPPVAPAPAGRSRGGGPLLWYVALLFALLTGAEVSLQTLLPLFYEREHGVPAPVASMLFTVHLAGLAAGRFLTLGCSARVSHRAIIGGCLATAVFIVPAIVGRDWFWWAAGLFLAGGMHSGTWATLYAQSAERMDHAPTLLNLGIAFGCLAGIAACVVASSRIAEWSLAGGIWFSMAVLAAFALCYFAGPFGRAPAVRDADG